MNLNKQWICIMLVLEWWYNIYILRIWWILNGKACPYTIPFISLNFLCLSSASPSFTSTIIPLLPLHSHIKNLAIFSFLIKKIFNFGRRMKDLINIYSLSFSRNVFTAVIYKFFFLKKELCKAVQGYFTQNNEFSY